MRIAPHVHLVFIIMVNLINRCDIHNQGTVSLLSLWAWCPRVMSYRVLIICSHRLGASIVETSTGFTISTFDHEEGLPHELGKSTFITNHLDDAKSPQEGRQNHAMNCWTEQTINMMPWRFRSYWDVSQAPIQVQCVKLCIPGNIIEEQLHTNPSVTATTCFSGSSIRTQI